MGRFFQGDNVLTLRNLKIEVCDFGIEWKDVLTGGMNSGNVSTISSNGPPASWVDYAGLKANGTNANPLTQAATETPYNLMSTNNTIATAANAGSNSADNLWMLVEQIRHLRPARRMDPGAAADVSAIGHRHGPPHRNAGRRDFGESIRYLGAAPRSDEPCQRSDDAMNDATHSPDIHSRPQRARPLRAAAGPFLLRVAQGAHGPADAAHYDRNQ